METAKQLLLDEIEPLLAERFPDVELVDIDLRGGRNAALTLYIDRPGGVDLEVCAAVSHGLDELHERYALEVSSPGLERPLRTVKHFVAAQGRTVVVRTRAPRDGRSNYRGALASTDDDGITLALDDGTEATIAYDAISKAHVVFNFDTKGGQNE